MVSPGRRAQFSASHHRASSAPVITPTPQISVEDTTQPLTNPEPPSRPNSLKTPATPPQGHIFTKARRRSTWRKQSQGVSWKKRWDGQYYPWHTGRVLVVDCYSRDHSDDGRRKTQAYEFTHANELREFYTSGPGKTNTHILRIIHVQNAVWAREFLLDKFSIEAGGNDVVATAFGRWAKYDKPQYRAGKPVLNAKSFRTSRDPWRGVSRTGFVVDYFKSYKPGVIADDPETDVRGFKFMDLNHWEEESGNVPVHGYDVYVQRISVYIQRNEGPVTLHPGDVDSNVNNPYGETTQEWVDIGHVSEQEKSTQIHHGRNGSIGHANASQAHMLERISSLDNGSTIIVFESSQTSRPSDTLIQAREEIEVRWRRLMFYLNRDDLDEPRLTLECMDLVLKDIFKGLHFSWEKLLRKGEEHVDILEDKIYENPADESRAPELWKNSSLWLKIEKLMSLQIGVVSDVQMQMKELADTEGNPKEEWFKNTPKDLARVSDLIQEELIKPTSALSDLMYKSVGIRDARHSIELGSSMWRLSWITFIFLPLTFIGGFFGMNVDVFQSGPGFPSIKWYFVASIPLMVLVVVLYLFIKSSASNKRSNPRQRGIYEEINTQFATDHPHLWSRTGPKSYIKPNGMINRVKWTIVQTWFHPSKTISKRTTSGLEEMSLWARVKRRLTVKWLDEITLVPDVDDEDVELGRFDHAAGVGAGAGAEGVAEFSTVNELLMRHTAGITADNTEMNGLAAHRIARPSRFSRFSQGPRSRSSSGSRRNAVGDAPSSIGSEMVVEEDKSDDESSAKERRVREVALALGLNVGSVGLGGREDGSAAVAGASVGGTDEEEGDQNGIGLLNVRF